MKKVRNKSSDNILMMIEKLKHPVTYLLLTAFMLIAFLVPASLVQAQATDEIQNFTIKVDVEEDASLKMTYHIDWTVLDDSIGKLEWIDLGVPNSFHTDITPLSKTIDHINDNGSKLAIYLDRSYGEGETVSLDFSLNQDHLLLRNVSLTLYKHHYQHYRVLVFLLHP